MFFNNFYSAVQKAGTSEGTNVINLHRVVGIIVLSLVIFQLILGVLQVKLIYENEVKSEFLLKYKVFHKYNGILVTYLSFISIIVGGGLLYQE